MTVLPYGSNAQAYKLPVGSSSSKEYFLLSNRQNIGFDAAIPGQGLIIEHIDENQSNNSDENHYLVDIEQADGQRDLNIAANSGDSNDPYPIASNNAFTGSTSPNSNAYSGSSSNISVTNIQRAGANITARINVGGVAAKSWYYNKTVQATYATYVTQVAYGNFSGLGWRRIAPGSSDAVTKLLDLLNEACANGRKVHVYGDGTSIYNAYMV